MTLRNHVSYFALTLSSIIVYHLISKFVFILKSLSNSSENGSAVCHTRAWFQLHVNRITFEQVIVGSYFPIIYIVMKRFNFTDYFLYRLEKVEMMGI